MSRLDSILDSIVDSLGVASITLPSGVVVTKPAGLTVNRQRAIPIDTTALPEFGVYLLGESVDTGPTRERSRLARRKAQVVVQLRIDAGSATPDQALDPYRRWAVLAVCLDPRRNNLTHDITEIGTEWDQETRSSRLAIASTVFLVDYVTSAFDIDAAT
mgnify:CR=1 FL=1